MITAVPKIDPETDTKEITDKTRPLERGMRMCGERCVEGEEAKMGYTRCVWILHQCFYFIFNVVKNTQINN